MESTIRKCTCPDWEENISILNAPYSLGLVAVGAYTGKSFDWCPWCGSKLLEIKFNAETT